MSDGVIWDYCISGHYSGISLRLKIRAGKIARKWSYPKVGITCNPEARWHRYSAETEYNKMYVLYETRSLAYVRDAERELIEHLKDIVENLVGGGGGNWGSPPYYVYVVVV
jgi:hypothetical protein